MSKIKYIGKTEPYSQQTAAFNKTANFIYAAYFMEQGTGKTKVVIDRSVHLWEAGKIDGVMVLCPKSLTATWEEEIVTHCPDRAQPIVAVWNSSLTKKTTAALEAVLYNTSKEHLPILIMNIEAIRTVKGQKLAHWWLRRKAIHLVCDESSWIKTPSAQQTTCAINLARLAKARSIMTGTPVSNSPADYYAQLHFLMPNPLGFSNYYSFRARYCVLETKMTRVKPYFDKRKRKMIKVRQITTIKGQKNAEELKKKLLPFSYFCKKKDCLDLPDKIYHTRTCELTTEGLRIYKDICKQIITEISIDRFITTEIMLSKLMRLQQVIGGFLPSDDDPEAEQIPGENPKLNLMVETIEQFPGPTLIWARYKAEHLAILKALRAVTSTDKIAEITGRIKKNDREIFRRAFQSGHVDYLVCTQSCAGYGYTFTAAENEIYYSNTFSHEHRVQSEDRPHRIGQTKHVNVIDLWCPVPSAKIDADMKIKKALAAKKDMADLLTDVKDLL